MVHTWTQHLNFRGFLPILSPKSFRDCGISNLLPNIASDRQSERNPRAFLEEEKIQAVSRLDPDRENFISFLVNYPPTRIIAKLVTRNSFRIEAQEILTPNLNSSRSCCEFYVSDFQFGNRFSFSKTQNNQEQSTELKI